MRDYASGFVFFLFQNDMVFRVDFPKNALTFGHKIKPYTLSNDMKCGTMIRIFVAEVNEFLLN